MKNRTDTRAVLSIYVSPTSLEGVLVEASDGPARIVHRVVRQRQRQGEAVGAGGDLSAVVPGLKTSEESDFTIEIGDGSGSTTEPNIGPVGNGTDASSNGTSASSDSMPFNRPLKEMVAECAQHGHPDPEIAFCVTPPEVSFVELTVPDAGKDGEEARLPARKKLIELLETKLDANFDASRVAFYPMAPQGGKARCLAVVPTRDDAVTRSLNALFNSAQPFTATPRLMEAEATMLATLMRQQPAEDEATSAVVRVGTDDTLILFFEGQQLRHYERLRSLTSYDMPDTICSRVMLQQDERKLDALDAVFVTGAHEERLVDAFRNFYPDAAVLPLAEALPPEQWSPDEGRTLSPNRFLALATAMRVLYPPAEADLVDLLSSAPRRSLRSFAPSWHTTAAFVLLVACIAFFGWRYVAGEAQIAQERELLAQDPVQMPETSPEEVRAQITELQATYAEYNNALEVLDSLLVGSDMWSRTLEQTSTLTNNISQIWFRNWQPDGNRIRIQGYALQRGNIAVLARALDATIEQIDYDEINDVRAYAFTMTAPIAREMPEVALYLREIAEGAEQEDVDDDAAPLLEADQPHE